MRAFNTQKDIFYIIRQFKLATRIRGKCIVNTRFTNYIHVKVLKGTYPQHFTVYKRSTTNSYKMYGGTRVEEDLADLRTSRYLYFIAAAAENQTCTSKVGRGAPPPLPPALSAPSPPPPPPLPAPSTAPSTAPSGVDVLMVAAAETE